MNIYLTRIQYLHISAFLQRWGFKKLVGDLPITSIEIGETGSFGYNMFISGNNISIDKLMEFLQLIKNI